MNTKSAEHPLEQQAEHVVDWQIEAPNPSATQAHQWIKTRENLLDALESWKQAADPQANDDQNPPEAQNSPSARDYKNLIAELKTKLQEF